MDQGQDVDRWTQLSETEDTDMAEATVDTQIQEIANRASPGEPRRSHCSRHLPVAPMAVR